MFTIQILGHNCIFKQLENIPSLPHLNDCIVNKFYITILNEFDIMMAHRRYDDHVLDELNKTLSHQKIYCKRMFNKFPMYELPR